MNNKFKAFYLIELLIVMVIVGIMVVAAYPVYNNYMVSSRRAEAKTSLFHLHSLMERHFTKNNTYATATIAASSATDVLNSNLSENGWYKLDIVSQSDINYSLTATPQNKQAENDTTCGTLTFDRLGTKGVTGPGPIKKCW